MHRLTPAVLATVAVFAVSTVALAHPRTEDARYRSYLASASFLTPVEVAPSTPIQPVGYAPDAPDSPPDAPGSTGEPTSGDPARDQLRAFLEAKGSPYAQVDVIGYCDAAGISRQQCRLLLAICGAESDHGTQYRNSKDHADEDARGRELFNCGGVKRGSWNKPYWDSYNPRETGWWLVRFPSWDVYWRLYTAGMKAGHFDQGRDTAGELCSVYVGGGSCGAKAWRGRVDRIAAQIGDLG